MSRHRDPSVGRRSFLRRGSAAGFGLLVGQALPASAQEIKPKPAEKKPEAKPAVPPAPVTCAVIGLGDQGREILRALSALPGANVKLVCDSADTVHKRALDIATKATAVADHRKVLDDKSVQAIWVATPTHMHKELVLAALQAGKHVYCEAPLAHTAADAKAIAQAAASSKQVFQAGLQRRANHLEQHVQGFFKTGALSKLASGRASWSKKTTWKRPAATPEREAALNWRLDPKVSTGLLGEVGIHQLDLASYFLRARPVSVLGMGGVMVWKDGRQVPDTVQAIVEYPGGFRLLYSATLGNSFEADVDVFQGSDAAIMLHKDRAWLFKEADAPNLGWEVYATKENIGSETGIALVANATKLLDEGLDPSENRNAYTKGPLYYACESFLEAVRGKGKPAVTAAQGYEATVIALKANEAVVSNTKVVFRNEWFAV